MLTLLYQLQTILFVIISLRNFAFSRINSEIVTDEYMQTLLEQKDMTSIEPILKKIISNYVRKNNNNEPTQQRRKLQTEPIRECNTLIDTYSQDEVKQRILQFLEELKDKMDSSVVKFLENIVNSEVKYGISSYKVCASCLDFNATNSYYEEFCGEGSYGYDSVVSGVLFLPFYYNSTLNQTILNDGNGEIASYLKGSIWLHPSESDSFYVGSEGWSYESVEPTQNVAFLITSLGGTANLVPDYLGYGESYNYYKSYLIKQAYQTSIIPLYFQSQKIVKDATNCNVKLLNDVVVSGYSEGGYATIAVADAMKRLGFNIIYAQAGAGPYQLSKVQIRTAVESVKNKKFPNRYHFTIALWGSAYSTTNPNLDNFNQGQNLASDYYLSTTNFTHNIVDWTLEGLSRKEINDLIPDDKPLLLINDDLLDFIQKSIENNVTNPCHYFLKPGKNDKICAALFKNDLENILLNKEFDYTLCHSPDDELVSYLNIPNDILRSSSTSDSGMNAAMLFDRKVTSVSGNHDDAGLYCFLNFMLFFTSKKYTHYDVSLEDGSLVALDDSDHCS